MDISLGRLYPMEYRSNNRVHRKIVFSRSWTSKYSLAYDRATIRALGGIGYPEVSRLESGVSPSARFLH